MNSINKSKIKKRLSTSLARSNNALKHLVLNRFSYIVNKSAKGSSLSSFLLINTSISLIISFILNVLYGIHMSLSIPLALVLAGPLAYMIYLYCGYIENKYCIFTENLFAIPKIKKIHKEYRLDNLYNLIVNNDFDNPEFKNILSKTGLDTDKFIALKEEEIVDIYNRLKTLPPAFRFVLEDLIEKIESDHPHVLRREDKNIYLSILSDIKNSENNEKSVISILNDFHKENKSITESNEEEEDECLSLDISKIKQVQ